MTIGFIIITGDFGNLIQPRAIKSKEEQQYRTREKAEVFTPLSIVKQPAFEMGELSMQLLLDLIESKRPVTDFETRVLNTELIIRESTTPVKV